MAPIQLILILKLQLNYLIKYAKYDIKIDSNNIS